MVSNFMNCPTGYIIITFLSNGSPAGLSHKLVEFEKSWSGSEPAIFKTLSLDLACIALKNITCYS